MDFQSRQPSPLCPILMTPIETAIKIQPDVSIYKPLGFWNPVKANNASFRWCTQNTNHWVCSAFGRVSPDRLASSVVRHLFSSLWTGRFNKLKFLYKWWSFFLVNKKCYGKADNGERMYTKRTFYKYKKHSCSITSLRDIWY